MIIKKKMSEITDTLSRTEGILELKFLKPHTYSGECDLIHTSHQRAMAQKIVQKEIVTLLFSKDSYIIYLKTIMRFG